MVSSEACKRWVEEPGIFAYCKNVLPPCLITRRLRSMARSSGNFHCDREDCSLRLAIVLSHAPHVQDKSSAGGNDESANVDPWIKAAKEVRFTPTIIAFFYRLCCSLCRGGAPKAQLEVTLS